MISVLFVLAGCTYSSGSIVVDPDDERAHSLKCDGGDLEACYKLRVSENATRRRLALGRACDGGFRDSCALLYHQLKDGTELGDDTYAFSGALGACRQGDPELCQAALNFGKTHPNYDEVVEKHRAELEALLAEHSK